MNLVFLIDNGKTIGGGDYAMFKFAQHLAKIGHNVIVYAANYNSFLIDFGDNPNLIIKIRNEISLNFKGIGFLNRIWGLIYLNCMIKPYLSKNKIDYLFGYLREPARKVVMLGKKYNIRTVNFVFETPVWMKKQLGDKFLKEFKGQFRLSWEKTKQAYEKTDILIPISMLTQKEVLQWVKRPILAPIYPGIETISKKKQVQEENQVIYVGRLNAYKNINEIIIALSKIDNPPIFVVVGTGEEEQNLKNLAKKYNVKCNFMGSLSDEKKTEEIAKSIFMVFPSSFEGFGMPPGEALMLGKPCICSDIPIFKEIYKDSVLYFTEHNINELAIKIEYLSNNIQIRKKLGLKGKKYISGKYTWKKSAEKIEKILLTKLKSEHD